MSDDTIPFASKVIASIVQKSRIGMAIQAVIVAIALFTIHLNYMTMDPNSSFAKAIVGYENFFVYYAIATLCSMAYMIIKRPFITPEVKHTKCNFCGEPMSTVKLKCEKCTAKSSKE